MKIGKETFRRAGLKLQDTYFFTLYENRIIYILYYYVK